MTKNKILILTYIVVVAVFLLLETVFGYDLEIPQPYRTVLYVIVISISAFFIAKGLKKKNQHGSSKQNY